MHSPASPPPSLPPPASEEGGREREREREIYTWFWFFGQIYVYREVGVVLDLALLEGNRSFPWIEPHTLPISILVILLWLLLDCSCADGCIWCQNQQSGENWWYLCWNVLGLSFLFSLPGMRTCFTLLIHMSIIWIYVMSHVWTAGHPSWKAKTFNVGHYTQTIQPDFCIAAVLIDTMISTIFYRFHLPWPCQGVARSAQSKTYWLHFLAHFSTDQDCFWVRFSEMESNCCFTGCVKELECLHTFSCLWMDLIEIRFSDRYCYTVHFDISVINWPWSWFKVTGVWESKYFYVSYLTKFSIDLNGI